MVSLQRSSLRMLLLTHCRLLPRMRHPFSQRPPRAPPNFRRRQLEFLPQRQRRQREVWLGRRIVRGHPDQSEGLCPRIDRSGSRCECVWRELLWFVVTVYLLFLVDLWFCNFIAGIRLFVIWYGEFIGTLLQTAIHWKDEESVRVLLGNGADVNRIGGYYGWWVILHNVLTVEFPCI
jgi:hypothetical protein